MSDNITMKEACKILGISRQTYYAWKKRGIEGLPIPFKLLDSKFNDNYFSRKEVEAFRKSNWFGND